jgi:hypothetical protein
MPRASDPWLTGTLPSRKGIVWLASYPRSGNTWLRFFIHCALEVMAGAKDDSVRITDIGKYSTWECSADLFAGFVPNPSAPENLGAVMAARPTVQQALLDRQKTSIFVKTHLVLANINGTPTINSAVTRAAVYVVRDPRDVAVSFAAHTNLPIDQIVEIMRSPDFVPSHGGVHEITSSWSRNVESWTVPARPIVHVARYEDMRASPYETFKGIAEHVGLRLTPGQLAKAIELSAFARLKAQEAELGFNLWSALAQQGSFRRGRAGGWREELSSEQAERIAADHREQMLRFGYR